MHVEDIAIQSMVYNMTEKTISAKNYHSRLMCVDVIVCNISVVVYERQCLSTVGSSLSEMMYCDWLSTGMMPGMPGAQQVAQMRQARPAGMQQQVRAASMTARPITGQQAVAVPPQRAPGL